MHACSLIMSARNAIVCTKSWRAYITRCFLWRLNAAQANWVEKPIVWQFFSFNFKWLENFFNSSENAWSNFENFMQNIYFHPHSCQINGKMLAVFIEVRIFSWHLTTVLCIIASNHSTYWLSSIPIDSMHLSFVFGPARVLSFAEVTSGNDSRKCAHVSVMARHLWAIECRLWSAEVFIQEASKKLAREEMSYFH